MMVAISTVFIKAAEIGANADGGRLLRSSTHARQPLKGLPKKFQTIQNAR
jgi:hypothetical protein